MGTKNIPASENPRDKKYKLHNVTLDQYTISIGNGLMGLRFSSSKYDVQSSLKTVVNYKRPTIFRQPCDRWQPLLSYWCSCNHEAKGSMQGKKGIIGKGDWCLESRWTFWCYCSYVGVIGFVLLCVFARCCCVCVWGGHVALNIMLWAQNLWTIYSGFPRRPIIFLDWLIDIWCLTPLSAISWWPVLMMEEARVPGENHRPWASN